MGADYWDQELAQLTRGGVHPVARGGTRVASGPVRGLDDVDRLEGLIAYELWLGAHRAAPHTGGAATNSP